MISSMTLLGKKWITLDCWSYEEDKGGDFESNTYKDSFPISSLIRFGETTYRGKPNCTIFIDHLGTSVRLATVCTYNEFLLFLENLI